MSTHRQQVPTNSLAAPLLSCGIYTYMPMPYMPNRDNMAELLQALDDVRDAAKRVSRELGMAPDRPEPAAGAGEPKRPDWADDEPLDFQLQTRG